MRLAVYGTLRRGFPDTGKAEGFSLVFPGTQSFPAVIKNEKGKGAVVELMDVTTEDLNMYDEYEGVSNGLYIRTTVPITLDNGKTEKAWIYVAGPQLWQSSSSFTEVPDGDWHSQKTFIMLDRVYEKEYKET
mgnify:FL=1|tara:strand:+ start:26281 stop:26676 length:396 start_codon:yes stop_codon:yes gene_type:complete